MCDGIVRNPAARYSWGSLSVRFFSLFNFDGLSGPFALMLAAEEGCKVRAIYRPHIARSSGVIQVAIWVPIRQKKTTFEMWIIDTGYSSHRLACPMRSTTGFQEENDCGINYFWRRLSQISPLNWTGWMVISQTVQAYVYCINLLETLPSVFENSARGMLVQDLMPFTLSFWPFFFGHCLLSLFLLSCQVSTTTRRACQFTHEDRLHWCNWGFDLLMDCG